MLCVYPAIIATVLWGRAQLARSTAADDSEGHYAPLPREPTRDESSESTPEPLAPPPVKPGALEGDPDWANLGWVPLAAMMVRAHAFVTPPPPQLGFRPVLLPSVPLFLAPASETIW